jgi:peptide/nickel transport system ATP-binding protein
MMSAVFQIRGLEVKYHTREEILTAVHNVNVDIGAGEIVGIVGESGCGKSTVASAAMCLLPPNGEMSAGQILFKGQDLRQLDAESMRRIRGREISMIFQDPMTNLNPVFSIETQIVDTLLAHQRDEQRMSRKEARKYAVEMLSQVGIPDAARRIKEYPHQFSGGMQQRIMIAMALQSNPALLIADEPTSALDVTLEVQIIDLIRDLQARSGMSILYITHDLGVVAQLCDRVIVMYAGNVVESSDVFAIFKHPKHPYTQALLRSHPAHSTQPTRLVTIRGRVPSLKELPPGCKFAPRCDLANDICHTNEPQYTTVDQQQVLCHAFQPDWRGHKPVVAVPTSAASTEGDRERIPAADEIVVKTYRLQTHFRDRIGLLGQILRQRGGVVRAVDDVSIEVQRGQTLALVGESGSGKTTLGRTILRLEDATGGEIWVEGQNITNLSQARVRPLRSEMQMIFQDSIASLSPRKKVSELLLEPFRIHNVSVDASRKVDELLETVGLSSEQATKYPHQLSGGQARRVGIARALALRPRLLIADEPTAGLDVSVAAGILNLLKDLREELNLTYIIITHNLNIIRFIADRVAVMYLGKFVEVADTARLFTDPRHPYTEALISAIAVPDPELRDKRQHIALKGEIPSSRRPPPGCPFHPRCRYAESRCSVEVPLLHSIPGEDRQMACWIGSLERANPVIKETDIRLD